MDVLSLLRVFVFAIVLVRNVAQPQPQSANATDVCDQESSAAYVLGPDVTPKDKQTLAFPLNLEYLETEFFCYGSLGHGLDKIDPALAQGGPPPKGAQIADLDNHVRDIIVQFCLQEVGHVRAIKATVKEEGFPRVLLDISKENFAALMDKAFEKPLSPPFDAYANSVNYMLASYVIPYVGETGYVGGAKLLEGSTAKELGARLLGIEAGQDAVIREWLYERKHLKVEPYPFTVAQFTDKISILRNNLDDATGVSDEGLTVPKCLGAEGAVVGNVLAADRYSLAYARTPAQVLEVVYASGSASKPGGFFPNGGDGAIAKSYLPK